MFEFFQLPQRIWSWLKKPDDLPLEINRPGKIRLLGQLLLIDILVMFLFLGINELIHLHLFKIEDPLIDWPALKVIPMMVLILPLIEELVFRFPLKYERNYLFQLLDKPLNGKIKDQKKRWFPYFLYGMILVFGLVHMFNYYNDNGLFFLLAPIIVGSQLIGGIILSFTRIKLGFFWACLQHVIFNSVVVFFGWLFFHQTPIVFSTEESGSVVIEELIFIDKEQQYMKLDLEGDVIQFIDANDVSLYDLLDSLDMPEVVPYEDRWVDVQVESDAGMPKSDFIRVLREQLRMED